MRRTIWLWVTLCGCATSRGGGAHPPVPLPPPVQELRSSDEEVDRQMLFRRTELFAGGLSDDVRIAGEQVAKYDETVELLAWVRDRYRTLRTLKAGHEARAALTRFKLDVDRLAPRHVEKLESALACAEHPADAASARDALDEAQVYLALLGLSRGAADPVVNQARERREQLIRKWSDDGQLLPAEQKVQYRFEAKPP